MHNIFVWNHKKTSQLTIVLKRAQNTGRNSQLCDINMPIRKTLYCNFVSLKTSSANVDRRNHGKNITGKIKLV